MTTGGPDAQIPDAGTLAAETPDAETLAAGGLEWLLGTARAEGPGLAWAATAASGEFDPSLYSGTAGIVITLLEAHRHFRDDRYADAALRGSRAIAAAVDGWDISSLYLRPVLAHGDRFRAATPDPARVLGQQRPLLRDRGRAGPRLRPARRVPRRPGVRGGPRR